jgi:hypothetical protein
MTRVRIVSMLLLSGCLDGNTISGRWTGCDADDDIYVNVPSPDGPIEADHFACESGGFEIDVHRDDFRLELDRRDADYHFIETVGFDLRAVHGDRDLGVIQF